MIDPLVKINGTPACAECNSLLCVLHRNRPDTTLVQIAHGMIPEPAPDVERVQCAGCGTILWRQ